MANLNIRIYYSDTDCGKVVYYANYLKYFEAGRTEMLRFNGIELEEFHSQGIIFVVVNVDIHYKAPARYNDLILIKSRLFEYSKKTFVIENNIYNEAGILLVTGLTKCACVNEQGKLISIPEKIIEVFKKFN